MKLRLVAKFLLVACFGTTMAVAEEANSPIGRHIEEFSLKDFRGKSHRLSDFAENKIVVVGFLGVECPLAKLYVTRMNELAKRYSDEGVAFVGIDANTQDSITELAAFARIHKIEFPLLMDVGNLVADQMGAVRTPEVFVLDKRRIVRYWGRIDDQYGVDYVRDRPERNDLAIAIDELLGEKKITVPVTEAAGCFIGRVREPNEDCEITYGNQISRILRNRCVECHRDGEIAPFSLTEYDEVVGWADTIAEVIDDRRMPPWHADPKVGKFQNDRHMPESEKQMVFKWVANGAPRGDVSNLPKPKSFTTGWQLPRKPDLEIPVSIEPFEVPAEGAVRYQWFSHDPGFEQDKWIEAAEIRPGNRAVVHHILAFARTPGGRISGGGARGYLAAYVPGVRVNPYPKGMAKKIPAGSELVFQVHYTPIGSKQLDQSRFGLVFADPDQVTHEITTTSAVQPNLMIPPNTSDYEADAKKPVTQDGAQLLSLMPHMHLRGSAFSYKASFPDGGERNLLDIPQYDFNWQTVYYLDQPMPLTKGTVIECVAHFDNSDGNLNNPDPNKTVRWGEQTWDEMMIGYFDIATPRRVGTESEKPTTEAGRIIRRFDKNGDGVVKREEVPVRIRSRFDQLDRNGDGTIDLAELEDSLKRFR